MNPDEIQEASEEQSPSDAFSVQGMLDEHEISFLQQESEEAAAPEAETEDQANAQTEPEDSGAAAAAIRVGDQELSIEAAASEIGEYRALREIDGVGELLEAGLEVSEVMAQGAAYIRQVQSVQADPAEFDRFLQGVLTYGIATHGASASATAEDLKDFQVARPELLAPDARVFYNVAAHVARESDRLLREANATAAAALKELAALKEERLLHDKGPELLNAVRAQHPGIKLSAGELTGLMSKHQTTDPIKAVVTEEVERRLTKKPSLLDSSEAASTGRTPGAADQPSGSRRQPPRTPPASEPRKVSAKGKSPAEILKLTLAGVQVKPEI